MTPKQKRSLVGVNKKTGVKFILRGSNGTYYRGMVAIGPCFGGTKAEALRFDSRLALAAEMSRHWACSGEVVEVKEGGNTND